MSSEPSPPIGSADIQDAKRRKTRASPVAAELDPDVGAQNGDTEEPRDEYVSLYVNLEPLPVRVPRIPSLSASEMEELERILEFDGHPGDSWREDWAGNLAFVDKEVLNPKERSREKQSFRQPLMEWAHKNPENGRYIYNLIRYVCHAKGTPLGAKKVLANANAESVTSMEQAIRRTSYDPVVLQQDGWTTAKALEPQGATGGAYLIGDRLRWQHSDAVVIAYDHDEAIGDLWKAIWTDQDQVMSFDLEAEELLEAKRKYERRQQRQKATKGEHPDSASRRSARFAVSSDFRVGGVEHGIVLAASYSKGARPGVYWPARVMHASETSGALGKRSSSKQKLDLIFLSPYWNNDDMAARGRRVESLAANGSSAFNTSPLLQLETIDASEEMIREYPYQAENGIDIDQLRTAFRFTGLPRAAFRRFLDSHRLALALQNYAKTKMNYSVTDTERATAGLFETHPMAILAPTFPSVVLNLPLEYILSQLPKPAGEVFSSTSSDGGRGDVEHVIDLDAIVKGMQPPQCWGAPTLDNGDTETPQKDRMAQQPIVSTPGTWLGTFDGHNGEAQHDVTEFDRIFRDLPLLQSFFGSSRSVGPVRDLLRSTHLFLTSLQSSDDAMAEDGEPGQEPLVKSWVLLKRNGEDIISSFCVAEQTATLADWRRAAERIYKFMTTKLPERGFKNGVSAIVTDTRCNLHRTSSQCFERSVRLPAALKAVRLAGATQDGAKRLICGVDEKYVKFLEKSLLPRVHTASYLKRMKGRCVSATSDDDVIKLTDDSDGNGGEDTMGSRGTWTAAVCAAAVAVAGADMVVRGECVNAFCLTRPPGHHAGRSLHPMKAVSNGFCVLNSVACAATHATTPLHEGGLGLSRVCVIDFDVHHGNGTQDILCSTYDPRYLYISMHAGGPEVNGAAHDDDDDPNHEIHDLASNPKSGGIYPGRCGDTSPHQGVLNIPLGPKVTSHDVGVALVRHVSPAVEAFSPDLVILSAGFDAHKHDPMGLGSLSAEDFGHITEVACQMAFKTCSGRVLSVLEGGYGVPCCRPQKEAVSAPVSTQPGASAAAESPATDILAMPETAVEQRRIQPSKLLDLGDDLPDTMDDQVPYALQRRLEKCHAEGFIECVMEHVNSLSRCSLRK